MTEGAAFQDGYPDELSCYGCGRLDEHGLNPGLFHVGLPPVRPPGFPHLVPSPVPEVP